MDVENGMKWMRCALTYCLILMVPVSANAQSRGMDCARPGNNIEKLVCSDYELVSMNACVEHGVHSLWGSSDPQDEPIVIAQHQRWVNEKRDRCTDLQCLRKVYSARLAELNTINPQADCVVSCEEVKRYPDKIFLAGVDTGTGAIDFDYGCKESLGSLPFLQKLSELTEAIRNDRRECDGTSMYEAERDHEIALAFAGMHPRLFASKELGYEVPDARDILRRWARTSRHNNQLYKRFMTEFEKSHQFLSSHYQVNFGMKEQEARRIARKALSLFLYRAVGDFPSDLESEEPACLPGATH